MEDIERLGVLVDVLVDVDLAPTGVVVEFVDGPECGPDSAGFFGNVDEIHDEETLSPCLFGFDSDGFASTSWAEFGFIRAHEVAVEGGVEAEIS